MKQHFGKMHCRMDLSLASLSFLFIHCELLSRNGAAATISNGPGAAGTMYLDQGLYKGVLVAVDPQVRYDSSIYTNLQDYLVQLSESLFTATSIVSARRFGEVTVLLPKTWPTVSSCATATSEILQSSNFVVERDTTQYGARPHTQRHSATCGEPGEVLYLPESFVRSLDTARQFGANIGKTLLHEWSHLRYGLFDEYDHSTTPSGCLYLGPGDTRPIKCSKQLEGRLVINDAMGTCAWTPDRTQQHHVMGSIMYDPQLDAVITYCNKTGAGLEHNSDIPNPQNDRCNGRSAWEVLMQHPDFRLHTESASENSNGVSIRCIQERELDRMVLVMDISGSMQEDHRIIRMQQDVQLFLKSMPCRDTSLGMVEFSSNNDTKIVHPLVSLDDNMESLLDSIPVQTRDFTCIGCGINKAIELLQSSGQTVNGSVLVIFTDGEENQRPYISEVQDSVLERGIVVYTILLREYASNHPLLNLASVSGGRSCVLSNNQQNSYYDCLNAVLHHRSPQTAPMQLFNRMVSVRFLSTLDTPLAVDGGTLDRVTIVITWSLTFIFGCQDTIFSAHAPNGSVISNNTIGRYSRNEALRTVSMDASGYPAGRWFIRMKNDDYWEYCDARLLVEARRLLLDCSEGLDPEQQQPVLIFPSVGSTVIRLNPGNDLHENAVRIYTEVLRGSDPVLNASVKAEIENDQGDQWTVDLEDNGAGADAEAGDGVYSRYFTNFTTDGTYTVKIDVHGTNDTRVLVNNSTGNGTVRYEPVDPFQRTQGSNYFEVVGLEDADEEQRAELFPPSSVTDLRVQVLSPIQAGLGRKRRQTAPDHLFFVSVQWTAVEIHDSSPGARYDIRIAISSNSLREDWELSHRVTQDDLHQGILNQIQPFGVREHFVIAFDKSQISIGVYYVAMKTIDGGGLSSTISNIGLFTFTAAHALPSSTSPASVDAPEAANASPTPPSSSSLGDNEASSEKKNKSSFPVWVYYVLGGLGAALILMGIILCYMCIRRSKKSKHARYEHTVQANFPGSTDLQHEPYCTVLDLNDDHPGDKVSLSPEPDLIQHTHGVNFSQTPDVRAHVSASLAGSRTVTPAPSVSRATSATWPSKTPGKRTRKQRPRVFKTTGKGTFFSELKKKFRASKSSMEDACSAQPSQPPTIIQRQWSNPREPVQNIPYSNPLYGQALTSHEMVLNNSVINAPYAMEDKP